MGRKVRDELPELADQPHTKAQTQLSFLIGCAPTVTLEYP